MRHEQFNLDKCLCSFAIAMHEIDWQSVKNILSVDATKSTVIIELTDTKIYLVEINNKLFNALYKAA
jgi:hypothetical protein